MLSNLINASIHFQRLKKIGTPSGFRISDYRFRSLMFNLFQVFGFNVLICIKALLFQAILVRRSTKYGTIRKEMIFYMSRFR